MTRRNEERHEVYERFGRVGTAKGMNYLVDET